MILLISSGIFSSAQNLLSFEKYSTLGDDEINFIELSSSGEIYISGNRYIDSITAAGCHCGGGFQSIYDSSANMVIALTAGDNLYNYSTNVENHNPIFLVNDSGYIRVCGYYNDTTLVVNTIIYDSGDYNCFLESADPSGMGVVGKINDQSVILDMKLNDSKGCVMTGYINGVCNFDPFNPSLNFIPNGPTDIILARYEETLALWIKKYNSGGTSEEAGTGITLDHLGNVYFTGYISSDTQFDSTLVIAHYPGQTEGFVAKTDPFGNLLWVKYAGSKALDVDVDSDGNCYVVGYATDSGYFDTTMFSVNSSHGLFVAKLNTNGDYQWVRFNSTDHFSQANAIAIDDLYNCYFTGTFMDTLSLNANLTLYASNCASPDTIRSAFIASYDSSGIIRWGKSIQSCYSSSEGIGIDVRNCKVAFCGLFNNITGSVFLDGDSLTSIGGNDGYFAVLTLDSCFITTKTNEVDLSPKLIEIFPNPASTLMNISMKNEINLVQNILIYDQSGKAIRTDFTLLSESNLSIDVSGLNNGIYLLRVVLQNHNMVDKYFVVSR